MINVSDYIQMILHKKKWTNAKLCQKLNKIEEQLGESRTTPQNISNYFHGQWSFRPKVLVKYEKALGLQPNILVSMVAPPTTKEGQKELKEIIKKVGEIK
mgnify:FL=1|jgi:hypothetical protein